MIQSLESLAQLFETETGLGQESQQLACFANQHACQDYQP